MVLIIPIIGIAPPQITAILWPCKSKFPLDSCGGWSKIIDISPRYLALFLPRSRLWRFHGLDTVESQRRPFDNDHNEPTNVHISDRPISSDSRGAQSQPADIARLPLRPQPVLRLACIRQRAVDRSCGRDR